MVKTSYTRKTEDSNLPEGLKELANLALDSRELALDREFPSSAEAFEAVANTTEAGAIDDAEAVTVDSAVRSRLTLKAFGRLIFTCLLAF